MGEILESTERVEYGYGRIVDDPTGSWLWCSTLSQRGAYASKEEAELAAKDATEAVGFDYFVIEKTISTQIKKI